MPGPVAEATGSDDIRSRVRTSVATGVKMLSRALKESGLARGEVELRSKLPGGVLPHGKPAVEAAVGLAFSGEMPVLGE
jgi:hypothetical protein